MFTNILYQSFFTIFYSNEFISTECSLLSRVKNPVEHFSITTLPPPENIFRYEPYIGS